MLRDVYRHGHHHRPIARILGMSADTYMCADVCANMCVGTCVDVCADMCVYSFAAK